MTNDNTSDLIKRSDVLDAILDYRNTRSEMTAFHLKGHIAVILDRINSLPSIAVNAQTNNGWKLVPIEPTEVMLLAGGEADDNDLNCDINAGVVYKAMLNAAPNNTNSIETNSAPVAHVDDDFYTLECAAQNMRLSGELTARQVGARWELASKLDEFKTRLAAPSQSVNEALLHALKSVLWALEGRGAPPNCTQQDIMNNLHRQKRIIEKTIKDAESVSALINADKDR